MSAPFLPDSRRPAPDQGFRRFARIALLPALAFSLSHCAGKGYKAANYSPEKLATPDHNMSQREYPFDSDGNYRKDWVKSGSTRPGSAVTKRTRPSEEKASSTPAPAPAPAPTRVASSSSSSSRPPQTITPPRTTVQPTHTAAPAAKPAPKPKPAPAPKPKARYHTVQAKQTLWAISQRYKVSVDALKRANGLRSDLIRPGQSLRIP